MALTVDGRVFSWGEGDDGKLGHCSRLSCDTPRLIEALKSKRIRDIGTRPVLSQIAALKVNFIRAAEVFIIEHVVRTPRFDKVTRRP